MKKLQVGFDAMLRATPTAFHNCKDRVCLPECMK